MSCAIPCATCGIFVEPLVEVRDGIAVVTVTLSVGIAVARLFGIETSQVKISAACSVIAFVGYAGVH